MVRRMVLRWRKLFWLRFRISSIGAVPLPCLVGAELVPLIP